MTRWTPRGGLRWFLPAAVAAACGVAGAIVAIRGPGDGVPRKASFDSLAPPGAPAHWLPPEDWVYNHWLPYDEGRLYALLGATRGDIWRQLRDDRHTLAELARARGWADPARLATALVAPRRGRVPAAMHAMLRERAERTITQGHLAQHLFFHSLHQFAIPSEAPAIFGVTDAEFRALRRTERSPLEIGRIHGRSPSQMQALAAGVLRERAGAGIGSGAMTARQGRLLLARQLAQLPRWLAQARYNGPPPTHRGELTRLPRDYAANPSMSADGRHVAFEAYRQHLPTALARGEIAVLQRRLGAGAAAEVSRAGGPGGGPESRYNASVSGDGRLVAFEAAAGNRNFAKRYGAIRVFVRDLAVPARIAIGSSHAAVSRSRFNPVMAAGGSAVAHQQVQASGRTQVMVTRLASRRTVLASRRGARGPAADADTYEPSISADGTRVAFTTAAGNLGATSGRSQVFVRDLRRRVTEQVTRVRGYASAPAISGDGRRVAYVASRDGRSAQVYLRDLDRGTTVRVSSPRHGIALGPAVSTTGRFIAYTTIRDDRSSVELRDLREAAPIVVSRPTGEGEASADGDAADPSISGDGRRIAFSSTATNLAPGKPDDRRGIFVRDVHRGTTMLVSPKAPPPSKDAVAQPVAAPPKPLHAPARLAPRRVAVLDNAFNQGRDRPVVRLRPGQRLTWLWRSRQSHQVTLVSGPGQVRSATQAHGRFRTRLSRPGTYRFVCSIHAPGMRMTAVVRRPRPPAREATRSPSDVR